MVKFLHIEEIVKESCGVVMLRLLNIVEIGEGNLLKNSTQGNLYQSCGSFFT